MTYQLRGTALVSKRDFAAALQELRESTGVNAGTTRLLPVW